MDHALRIEFDDLFDRLQYQVRTPGFQILLRLFQEGEDRRVGGHRTECPLIRQPGYWHSCAFAGTEPSSPIFVELIEQLKPQIAGAKRLHPAPSIDNWYLRHYRLGPTIDRACVDYHRTAEASAPDSNATRIDFFPGL